MSLKQQRVDASVLSILYKLIRFSGDNEVSARHGSLARLLRKLLGDKDCPLNDNDKETVRAWLAEASTSDLL